MPTAPPEPTHDPVRPPGLASVLARNIRALEARRRAEERRAGFQTKAADAVTRFTGSPPFVYLHLLIVAAWVGVNTGLLPVIPRFDPTFVILATTASVEAIFLSTFVLISQNRQAELADRRSELDLQITLLAEHEVTRSLSLLKAIADKLGVEDARDEEIVELERDVAPEAVLDEIEAEEGAAAR